MVKDDLVITSFLNFLAHAITAYPQKIIALDTDFVARIRVLIGGLEIDLDTLLSEDDDWLQTWWMSVPAICWRLEHSDLLEGWD